MHMSGWRGVRQFLPGDMEIKIVLTAFEYGMETATMSENFQGAGAWQCVFTAPFNGRNAPCCAFAGNTHQINLSMSFVMP